MGTSLITQIVPFWILKWKFSPRVFVNINFCTNWYKLLCFGGFLGFSLLKLRNIFRYKQFVSLVMSRDSVFEKHQAQTGFSSLEILKKQEVREYFFHVWLLNFRPYTGWWLTRNMSFLRAAIVWHTSSLESTWKNLLLKRSVTFL